VPRRKPETRPKAPVLLTTTSSASGITGGQNDSLDGTRRSVPDLHPSALRTLGWRSEGTGARPTGRPVIPAAETRDPSPTA